MLEWHEWTGLIPPPEDELLLFAERDRGLELEQWWIVGTGHYQDGRIHGDSRLSVTLEAAWPSEMHWARIENLPGSDRGGE